jgi:hypothetical protein
LFLPVNLVIITEEPLTKPFQINNYRLIVSCRSPYDY